MIRLPCPLLRPVTLALLVTLAAVSAGCGSDTTEEPLDDGATSNATSEPDAGPNEDDGGGDADPDAGSTTDEDEDFVDEFDEECDGRQGSQECLEDGERTIRLNRPRRLGVIAAEKNGDRLRLEITDDSPLRERLSEGKVLARWRKDRPPLLHRVVELRWDGNVAMIRLERVGLRDAFKRGRIRRQFAYDEAMMMANPSMLTVGPADCSGSITGIGNPDISVEVTDCSFRFTPRIFLDIEWGGAVPSYIYFEAGGEVDADFEVEVEAAGMVAWGAESQLKALPDVPVPGFPILTIGVDVGAGYVLYASGEAYASAGFDYTAEAGLGFTYAKGSGFDGIFYANDAFTQRGPVVDFAGHVYGEVYLKPSVRLAIAGVLGGSAGLKTYAAIDIEADVSTVETVAGGLDISGNACIDFGVGFDPVFGVDVSVFGFDLAEEEWTVDGLYFSLLNQCFDYQTVSTSACTEADECMVDADCGGGLTPVCQLNVCDSSCSCARIEIEDCCTSNEECDDGNPDNLDICNGFNECVHRTQCINDSDCDDGLEATVDTCQRLATDAAPNGCKHEVDCTDRLDSSCFEDVQMPEDEDLCVTHADCDDDNPLTDDSCVGTLCKHTLASKGDLCNCFDGDPSTIDSCNDDGSCSFTAAPTQPFSGFGK